MSITSTRDNTMSVSLTNTGVKKSVTSYSMSKRYMNTMLRATVINILYHRLNINEKEFITKNLEEVSYKSFKPKSKNPFIREFHTYMIACKDAVEKNYLKEFYLFFMDAATGDIIENYKFSFQYAGKDEPPPKQKGEDLLASTCELLRTLEDLGKHKKYESEIQLKVELKYFDDTPEDYEPPAFRSIEENDSLCRKMDRRGNSVIIGTLFTGFHMLKCRGKGQIFDFPSSPTTVNEEEREENNDAIPILDSEEVMAERVVREPGRNKSSVMNPDIFTEDLSQNETEDWVPAQDGDNLPLNCTYMSGISNDDIQFFENCPCKIQDAENVVVDQVKCNDCNRIYHAPCVGYLDRSFMMSSYICKNCASEKDSIMGAIGSQSQDSRGLYRLRYIIGIIYKYGECPANLKTGFADTIVNLQVTKVFEVERSNREMLQNHEISQGKRLVGIGTWENPNLHFMEALLTSAQICIAGLFMALVIFHSFELEGRKERIASELWVLNFRLRILSVNRTLLGDLFNLEYKKPDLARFKRI